MAVPGALTWLTGCLTWLHGGLTRLRRCMAAARWVRGIRQVPLVAARCGKYFLPGYCALRPEPQGRQLSFWRHQAARCREPRISCPPDRSAYRFDALATATKGGCIEFVPGTFSNYNWDRKGVLSDKLRIKRMIDNGEIDMIWTFGTISGLYFADSGLGVPVLVIDSTSPEGAGIIGPGDYSNKPNVHVQKDLTRYSAEVVLFHNLLKFKRMGILVDSNEDNQSGQDIFEIRALAKTMGFELVPCYGDIMGRVPAQADVDFKRCLAMLSEENIDALFLTLVYRPEEPLFPYIKPFIDRGIPVYSQYGEQDVRGGALLSLSESDLTHAAIFQANVVRQIIIEGKKPEEISQHFHDPLSISFNMQTARLIEWQPSFEALLAIDNVYSHIEGADTNTGYNARMPEDEEARNSQHNMFDTSLSTNAAVLMQSKDSSSHVVKSASSQHP